MIQTQVSRQQLWCVQEGDLDSAIKKYKGYLPEDDIMLKFVQIALALHYTHSKVGMTLNSGA